MGINVSEGRLKIGGADAAALAEEFGTPLYVMDEETVREACRSMVGAIDEYYDSYGTVTYASKALCIKEMCRIVNEEGLGLDVVSGGELYTAVRAGFPTEKIHYHGNNKTDDEIKYGLACRVGKFIVDNTEELIRLDKLAADEGIVQNILLRITPGVEAHTHEFIKTGQIDSKFGSAVKTGAAKKITAEALKLKNVKLIGFHCHIGSQIFETEPFVEAARIMLDFINETEEEMCTSFEELVLGGGFGIKYNENDKPLPFDEILKPVLLYVKNRREKEGKKLIHLGFEPGRAIAGPAGVTLYTVGGVKEIPNVRCYASVDGGMSDNPRYVLYGAEYTFMIADRANQRRDKTVTVCGKCCESGDMLGENIALGEVKAGDILAVTATGAYNYSMASNYNRIPRPPVVFVKDSVARIAVKRETYEDICRNDM